MCLKVSSQQGPFSEKTLSERHVSLKINYPASANTYVIIIWNCPGDLPKQGHGVIKYQLWAKCGWLAQGEYLGKNGC